MSIMQGVCVGILFLVWGGWLSWFDWRYCRLPNALTLGGFLLILIFAAWGEVLRPAVVGALLLAGCYGFIWCVAPQGMGPGDVKFALGLGAMAALGGANSWLLAALLAPILTASWGLAQRYYSDTRRYSEKQHYKDDRISIINTSRPGIPHGPAMFFSTVISLLFSSYIT